METQGIDPWTFRMQSGRSTTELHPRVVSGRRKKGKKVRKREEKSKLPFFSLSLFISFPLSLWPRPLFFDVVSCRFQEKQRAASQRVRDIFEFPELYKRLVSVEKKGKEKKNGKKELRATLSFSLSVAC